MGVWGGGVTETETLWLLYAPQFAARRRYILLFVFYVVVDFNVLANALNNCGWERGKGRRDIETVKKKQRGQIV